MIELAGLAEQYIKQQQRQEHHSDTKTNLENRESKRQRVQAAKRRYTQ